MKQSEINKNDISWSFWQRCYVYHNKKENVTYLLDGIVNENLTSYIISVEKYEALNTRIRGRSLDHIRSYSYPLIDNIGTDVKELMVDAINEYEQ